MIPQSLLSMLGLCQRAGFVASGEVAVDDALKKRKAVLLILAADASDRTRERFTALASQVGVPCFTIGTRDELGMAIGKSHRAALAVQSRDFAKGIAGVLAKEGLTSVTGRG